MVGENVVYVGRQGRGTILKIEKIFMIGGLVFYGAFYLETPLCVVIY